MDYHVIVKRTPVTLHRLKILKKNATPEDYVEDTSVCNAGIPASTFCTVPMTTLISTFGYAAGDVIMAKLTAVNARGEGPASADSNIDIVAQVAPTAALTGFAATSAAGDVTLTWTKLTDGAQTGYSPITDYVITYQSTSNTLHTITVTDETASSYVIQNLTPAGELFTYTIKTVNIHGTSTAVATATNTLAGTAPTTLASPTVTSPELMSLSHGHQHQATTAQLSILINFTSLIMHQLQMNLLTT